MEWIGQLFVLPLFDPPFSRDPLEKLSLGNPSLKSPKNLGALQPWGAAKVFHTRELSKGKPGPSLSLEPEIVCPNDSQMFLKRLFPMPPQFEISHQRFLKFGAFKGHPGETFR